MSNKPFASPIQYCTNGKPCYDKKGAITAKNKRYQQDHEKLREYACEHGPHWHLTHWREDYHKKGAWKR